MPPLRNVRKKAIYLQLISGFLNTGLGKSQARFSKGANNSGTSVARNGYSEVLAQYAASMSTAASQR